MLKPLVLKNGITVLRLPKSSLETFVIGFVVKTGSAIEYGNAPIGISNFVERMFWKGTDKHPSVASLNYALESIGGEFVSNTGRELTEFYLKVPYIHQFKAISLIAEIIQSSHFSEREIEKEKTRIVEEIKNLQLYGESKPLDLTLSHLYENKGLGTPSEGSIESILLINQQYIANYLSHQYAPKNCYIVLGGQFDSKACLELIEQEWGLWRPRTLETFLQHPHSTEKFEQLPSMQFRQRGLSRNKIELSFILDGGIDPSHISDEKEGVEEAGSQLPAEATKENLLLEWSKLTVLNSILGMGLSSRLWLKCVDDEVLFESIGSGLELFKTVGFVQISGTTTESTQFTFALESILSVLEALKKTTLSINELTKAKEFTKGKLILEQEDILNMIIWKIYLFVTSGLIIDSGELIEYIQKVDANHIRSLAMDLFVPERMVITTVGTAKHTPMVDKLILKYLTSTIS